MKMLVSIGLICISLPCVAQETGFHYPYPVLTRHKWNVTHEQKFRTWKKYEKCYLFRAPAPADNLDIETANHGTVPAHWYQQQNGLEVVIDLDMRTHIGYIYNPRLSNPLKDTLRFNENVGLRRDPWADKLTLQK